VITQAETDREGVIFAIYHRAGEIDGRKDEKFAWTHSVEEAAECEACTSGNIPAWVKRSPK